MLGPFPVIVNQAHNTYQGRFCKGKKFFFVEVICELPHSGGSSGNNVADGGTSKSSYYVWFLGSREAKGLRGAEYIRPAVRHLLEYKTDACRKMTLQVR